MNIKGHDLNDEVVIEIGKFTILWNIFERSKCDYNCNPTTIKNACDYIKIDEEKQSKLSEVLNERRIWFCQDLYNYVELSLHPNNAKQSKEEDKVKMVNFLKREGIELTQGCLLVIHRVRNNLMHGLKLLEDLNDQLLLFKAINEVLESIE